MQGNGIHALIFFLNKIPLSWLIEKLTISQHSIVLIVTFNIMLSWHAVY